ncbi:hypothetical protein ACHAXA_001824 [Cyclostephanos tholiformis]|uniref:ABC1 atypical kinase-like domain-containing protein n=1 Tax=Cyclostephanos tholiformis TaxID=382380 RepID=A0ABD3RPL7_9STRA
MIFQTPANPTNRRASTHHRHLTTNGIIDIAMCRASPPLNEGKATNLHRRSSLSAISMAPLPAIIAGNLASIFKPPFSLSRILLLLVIASLVSFASFYTFHRGFRRTIQFWRGMAPLFVRYKYVTIKAERIDRVGPEEMERRLNSYRESTAPRLVDLILRMGGIYVKIGQVMGTIGQGLLPQQYLDALRPLQDGVPPRTYAEVSDIITRSTGKSMDELFVSFEELPIGSASIAQVHRARLRPKNEGEEPMQVVIKVQYPEVAELFEADLSNLELATRLFSPENVEVTRALRKRHENELNFTQEAENLRECTRDMQRHGLEPNLVRIPRVVDEICTPNVLAMEYLEGISLSKAIAVEQRRVAKALGMSDGDELKKVLASKMRKHFENGGGATGEDGVIRGVLGGNRMRLLNAIGPSAAALLRTYASVKDEIENAALSASKFGSLIRRRLSRGGDIGNPNDRIHDSMGSNNRKKGKVNLGRALKTLVHVHGIQLLLSGTYNADPHPGNILILPDGRLGLLDYGMVGRLSIEDRKTVAKTIMALSDNDKRATAKIYRENGYKVSFRDTEHVDDATLHRFASFHLDRFDLSPLTLDNGEVIDTLELFRNTREKVVPSFVEEGRRLGGLLMGVTAQAARPISLAKEWRPIAQDLLKKKVD